LNESNELECRLPITLPTSKVRIKRDRDGIEPIPPRKEILRENDYIEWQISYRDKESGKPIELGELIRLAYERYITRDELCEIIKKYGDETSKPFDELFRIMLKRTQQKAYYDFVVIWEKIPILHLDLSDGCYIEVVLRHKQRAVGYQSMVYIYIPVQNVITRKPLINRTAEEKEIVIWKPNKEHILGLIKAFLVASKDHRQDIKKLIRQITGYSCT